MCFIVAIVMLIFSFNFYNADNTLLAIGSLFVSLFFIFLMIKNILHVKKLREKKTDDN